MSGISLHVSVRSIQDLLSAVPRLTGFTPDNSLVIIGARPPRNRVCVTLRYDMPAGAETIAGTLSHAKDVLAGADAASMTAVIYGTQGQAAPIVAGLASLTELQVTEILRVDAGRYWSYTCTQGPDCCPPEGTKFTVGDVAGLDVPILADRETLAATLAPVTGAGTESMRTATQQAERRNAQLIADGLAITQDLLQRCRTGNYALSDAEAARITVTLRSLRIRDDLWARMDPAHAKAHLVLLTDLTRRAQPGYVAAPAALLAFAAWQSGNGALANIALDRALADQPRYSMAQLLRQVITAGAPPSLARLPMTPEEVAASYDKMADETDLEDEASEE